MWRGRLDSQDFQWQRNQKVLIFWIKKSIIFWQIFVSLRGLLLTVTWRGCTREWHREIPGNALYGSMLLCCYGKENRVWSFLPTTVGMYLFCFCSPETLNNHRALPMKGDCLSRIWMQKWSQCSFSTMKYLHRMCSKSVLGIKGSHSISSVSNKENWEHPRWKNRDMIEHRAKEEHTETDSGWAIFGWNSKEMPWNRNRGM